MSVKAHKVSCEKPRSSSVERHYAPFVWSTHLPKFIICVYLHEGFKSTRNKIV